MTRISLFTSCVMAATVAFTVSCSNDEDTATNAPALVDGDSFTASTEVEGDNTTAAAKSGGKWFESDCDNAYNGAGQSTRVAMSDNSKKKEWQLTGNDGATTTDVVKVFTADGTEASDFIVTAIDGTTKIATLTKQSGGTLPAVSGLTSTVLYSAYPNAGTITGTTVMLNYDNSATGINSNKGGDASDITAVGTADMQLPMVGTKASGETTIYYKNAYNVFYFRCADMTATTTLYSDHKLNGEIAVDFTTGIAVGTGTGTVNTTEAAYNITLAKKVTLSDGNTYFRAIVPAYADKMLFRLENGALATPNATQTIAATDAANCYPVKSAENKITEVTFPASTMGTSGKAYDGTPSAAKVVWMDSQGLITEAPTYAGGNITVKIGANMSGNAVVAVTDASNKILWSWHVWVRKTSDEAYNATGVNKFMKMNIGDVPASTCLPKQYSFSLNANVRNKIFTPATRYKTVHFQWGRKDPFPASSKIVSSINTEPTLYLVDGSTTSVTKTAGPKTIAEATANPLIFYTARTIPYDWFNGSTQADRDKRWNDATELTYYSPCPKGYTLPTCDGTNFGGYPVGTSTWTTVNGIIGKQFDNYGFVPAAGMRNFDDGALERAVDSGFYWSSSVDSEYGRRLFFISVYAGTENHNCRAFGFSVRSVEK